MVQVIDQLGRDHRNLRLLLDIVEEEMTAYQTGRVPDFDLLRMIAEYTSHYPDLVHHPREDAVFERLVLRDPGAKVAIGDLVEEHRRLSELTRRFAAAINNAAHDVTLPREWLDSLAMEYLQVNRLHMQAEEEHFLPRAIFLLTAPILADDNGRMKVTGGLAVYLGILPAAMITGHPTGHTETTMHGGLPSGPHAYHVVVAVFDEASGTRIANAEATVRVAPPGLTGTEKVLERMTIEDTVTYGNFFDMRYSDIYRIKVEIRRPAAQHPGQVSWPHLNSTQHAGADNIMKGVPVKYREEEVPRSPIRWDL